MRKNKKEKMGRRSSPTHSSSKATSGQVTIVDISVHLSDLYASKKTHPDFTEPQVLYLTAGVAVRKLENGNMCCGPSGAWCDQPQDQLSFCDVASLDLPQPQGSAWGFRAC